MRFGFLALALGGRLEFRRARGELVGLERNTGLGRSLIISIFVYHIYI
jgi:hypothetical protein